MKQLSVIFKRELGSYFATPLAYVFIVIFLVMSGVFTFYLAGFFGRNQQGARMAAQAGPHRQAHGWLNRPCR